MGSIFLILALGVWPTEATLGPVLESQQSPVSETPASPATEPAGARIAVDRVGYLPEEHKRALVINAGALEKRDAMVVSISSGRVVHRVVAGPELADPWSPDRVATIDFSAFAAPGRYRLRVGELTSPPFEIGDDVYAAPLRLLMRSFFLQRCGIALDDAETELRHAACHTEDGILAIGDRFRTAGSPWPAVGGWHDAGDFGKYVSTTTVTVARLLDVFERAPDRYGAIDLSIPPSARVVLPDWLEETAEGLRWLLRMQREDGAVYRKLSGRAWPPVGRPEDDRQPRFVYGISTEDTAKVAGVLAFAERVYRAYDEGLADRCLEAARRAWRYLRSEPEMGVDRGADDDSGSGPYTASATDTEVSLLIDTDDRLWAAAELWIATGEPEYLDFVEAHASVAPINLFEWKDPSSLGLRHLLSAPNERQVSVTMRRRLRDRLVAKAERMLVLLERNPYRLANHRFIWGSNKMAAECGILLAYAWELTGYHRFRDAAFDQLHYLFGRNHHDLTFVSGLGERSVTEVSHLWGRTFERTIPGLLVGGANALAQARIAPPGRGPMSYTDDGRSYATNENAIDYNASLIGLIGTLQSPVHAKRGTR